MRAYSSGQISCDGMSFWPSSCAYKFPAYRDQKKAISSAPPIPYFTQIIKVITNLWSAMWRHSIPLLEVLWQASWLWWFQVKHYHLSPFKVRLPIRRRTAYYFSWPQLHKKRPAVIFSFIRFAAVSLAFFFRYQHLCDTSYDVHVVSILILRLTCRFISISSSGINPHRHRWAYYGHGLLHFNFSGHAAHAVP